MDSNVFKFHQGEIYHQFHDGFMPGESYPQSYNDIVKIKVEDGSLKKTGCPTKNSVHFGTFGWLIVGMCGLMCICGVLIKYFEANPCKK